MTARMVVSLCVEAHHADTDWMDFAACRGCSDPEIFFPLARHGRHVSRGRCAAAVAVCRDCPVAAECLAYALAESMMDGIWGGCTASQRDTIRRDRRVDRGR